jgi:hypothetical protein
MGLAPIDLQTLFSQVDKVGKAQAALKEGQMAAQAMQGTKIQRKTDEEIQQVNQTQDTGDGVENINDQTSKKKESKNSSNNNQNDANENDDNTQNDNNSQIIRDPNLGNKISISC